ncbi:autoinducer binding domain-containing protein [Paraburkholderia sp.]|uniref:autoinducer binding domain-containing protein n=1 Tax=Paraburkholderia sp. TaxID=1926495 RepID=UPI00238592B6|nr:autoinducer binding domain-containing protein [Paraburkholderia sp.]MDE1180636.1 autoinducer binding domain-containing protein [Paraburkholderia sp.]
MRKWHEEKIERLAKRELSEGELHAEISTCADILDFKYWMFGIRLPIPISRPLTAIRSNFPANYLDDCPKPDNLEVDPIFHHCLNSTVPLVWANEPHRPGSRNRKTPLSWTARFGWSMSMRGPAGALTWFTLARNSSAIGADELAINEYTMIWLAHLAHARMSAFLLPGLLAGGIPRLSPREREVMRWTAEGKTAAEIGLLLGIAETTCIFHIGNATRKLGGVNKTQAATRAAVLGLIA